MNHRHDRAGGGDRDQTELRLEPAPGRQALVLAALSLGILLLGVQLWLLTIAHDLYLAGEAEHAWSLAVVSGLVFLGGLLALYLIRRHSPIGHD